MAVFFVGLDPEEPLPSMLYLWFITDPRRPREKNVSIKDVEQCKEKRLGSWSNHDLFGLDCSAETACLESRNGLRTGESVQFTPLPLSDRPCNECTDLSQLHQPSHRKVAGG